jgi:hypothetical protein
VSGYWVATLVAAIALLALLGLGVWAYRLVRRFRVLAVAYRRQLAAESARLGHRRTELLIELARRSGRTHRD